MTPSFEADSQKSQKPGDSQSRPEPAASGFDALTRLQDEAMEFHRFLEELEDGMKKLTPESAPKE